MDVIKGTLSSFIAITMDSSCPDPSGSWLLSQQLQHFLSDRQCALCSFHPVVSFPKAQTKHTNKTYGRKPCWVRQIGEAPVLLVFSTKWFGLDLMSRVKPTGTEFPIQQHIWLWIQSCSAVSSALPPSSPVLPFSHCCRSHRFLSCHSLATTFSNLFFASPPLLGLATQNDSQTLFNIRCPWETEFIPIQEP